MKNASRSVARGKVIDLVDGWEIQFATIREILNESIKHAKCAYKIDRKKIASEMSRLTGNKITEDKINKWTRGDGNHHHFPIEYSSAFAQVTGDPRILMWPAHSAGMRVLTGREYKKYRLFQLRQQEDSIRRERERLQAELAE